MKLQSHMAKKQNQFLENLMKKTQNFYILLEFLLNVITLLITVTIYCYLIKYRAKQTNVIISRQK